MIRETPYYDALVSPAETRRITSLSPREQDRREAAGTFPKSIRLGTGRNGRKARRLGELLDWCRERVAERNGRHDPATKHDGAMTA